MTVEEIKTQLMSELMDDGYGELLWSKSDFDKIDTIRGEDRRWSRTDTIVVEHKESGHTFAYDLEVGLTEMQEGTEPWSGYPEPQIREVEKRTTMVPKTEWVER